MNNCTPKFVFFGTPDIAVHVLDALKSAGFLPSLIVTNPDTPQGRKLILTPTPVAQWAETHDIPARKPHSLKSETCVPTLTEVGADVFIVAAYGKMIPKSILEIPPHGILNMHPSLLPLLRGPSPIRSAILHGISNTGVSIMLLNEKMDEGPIIAQREIPIETGSWPPRGTNFDKTLATAGGILLSEVLCPWIEGKIDPTEQDHARASYTEKITKEMGRIDLSDNPNDTYTKIRALDGWPGTYFFHVYRGKNMRVKIIDARMDPNGNLSLLRVIPEGKGEMSYEQFLQRFSE